MGALQQVYFNNVYNPLYDLTTARFSRYRDLQRRCVTALELGEARSLLCVGLGTGNEAALALRTAPHLSLTGVDLSQSALVASRRKLRRIGRTADLRIMNAESLAFADRSFDRVMCMHVMDFLRSVRPAISEIVRVLRPGGRFVATFPSRLDGTALGLTLIADHIRAALRAGRSSLAVTAETVASLAVGLVYVPLLARAGRHSFTASQIAAMIDGLPVRRLHVREEPAYQDFIVTGEKA